MVVKSTIHGPEAWVTYDQKTQQESRTIVADRQVNNVPKQRGSNYTAVEIQPIKTDFRVVRLICSTGRGCCEQNCCWRLSGSHLQNQLNSISQSMILSTVLFRTTNTLTRTIAQDELLILPGLNHLPGLRVARSLETNSIITVI